MFTLLIMNKNDINNLATIKDLEIFYQRIINSISDLFEKNKKKREFFSPKEFSEITGMKYSTVVYRCKTGKLKARQDNPNSAWQIFSSEIERYLNECNQNIS